jgi:uncharacterized membrane protein YdbT with pleckstrin-like domain
MGRYIDDILQPGEKIVFSGTIHWIIYLPGMAVMLVAVLCLTRFSNSAPAGLFWLIAAAMLAVIGMFGILRAWFRRWTTEIDVTDRRVVYKHGFIRRHTVEMNMDKIESVDVDQSVLGRLFDFGDITIRGTGVGIEPLHRIGAPLEFRNHVTAR